MRTTSSKAIILRLAFFSAILMSFLAVERGCRAADVPVFAEVWQQTTPAAVGLDRACLEQTRNYALTGGGAGIIIRHGKQVMEWGDTNRRYDLKSTTKAIGVTALGLAHDFHGLNIDSPTGEAMGDGAQSEKASGMSAPVRRAVFQQNG